MSAVLASGASLSGNCASVTRLTADLQDLYRHPTSESWTWPLHRFPVRISLLDQGLLSSQLAALIHSLLRTAARLGVANRTCTRA